MASITRSVNEVLEDILDSLQSIIRLEVKLTTAEIRQDVVNSRKTIVWAGVAALSGFFACAFLIVCGFFALRYAVPDWLAAAILMIAMASICALGFLMTQKLRIQRRRQSLERNYPPNRSAH